LLAFAADAGAFAAPARPPALGGTVDGERDILGLWAGPVPTGGRYVAGGRFRRRRARVEACTDTRNAGGNAAGYGVVTA